MPYQTRTDAENNPSSPISVEAERLDLLGAMLLLASHKRFLGKFVVGMVGLTTLVVFLIPNTYTGVTKVMPPQQSQSLSTLMMGQLGNLAGLMGAGKDLGLKNPSDVYQTMLQSNTVARALIERFQLQQVYGKRTLRDTEDKLKDNTLITVGKDGVITIEVDDRDPKRAAELANAYVDELRRVSQSIAAGEASQRRQFFQQQLQFAKEELSTAELEMKKTQEKTGLIELNSQARVIIETVARLRAQVTAKEVQLKAMQSFATDLNPDLLRTQEELRALRGQLANLEASQATKQEGSTQVPTGRVPESGLEYLRSLRVVKYYEIVFELLAKQFEAAKLDEARNATNIQVLDKAAQPEKKSRPKRGLIIGFFALLSLVIGPGFVLLRERFRQKQQDVEFMAKLEVLRSYLSTNKGLHK